MMFMSESRIIMKRWGEIEVRWGIINSWSVWDLSRLRRCCMSIERWGEVMIREEIWWIGVRVSVMLGN